MPPAAIVHRVDPVPPVHPFVVAAVAAVAGAVGVAWVHWLSSSRDVGVTLVTGVVLAALLLLSPRHWPLPLGAMFVAVTGVGLLDEPDLALAIAPACAAAVGAVLAAVLLRCYAGGPFSLRRVGDVVALTVAGAVGAFAGAATDVAVVGLNPANADYWEATAQGAVAAGLGIVVVTTLLLSWSTPATSLHRARAREAVLLGVVVVGLGVVAFRVSSDPRTYALVLVLLWAAIRFRLRGVSTAALALVAIADWAIARDSGPVVELGRSPDATLLAFQTFAAVALLGMLLLAAALDERDVAEARRYVVNDRFRRTFGSVPVGIAVTNLDGVITDANPALCRMLGAPRRELVGTKLESLRARTDARAEHLLVELGAGVDEPVERQYASANGDTVWAEVTESQVRTAHGEPDSHLVVLDDVTLRKDLEEQVVHAQKMDTVGRLAGSVAHDFNNLLAVMRGNAELLESDLAFLDQARQRLASMQRATDRATALTDDLLTFSRRSADEPETIDVHEVVAAAYEMLAKLVSAGVTLDVRLDATATRIDADPRRIEQVLVNLVVNASDAMPFGGRVVLATANVHAPDAPDEHEPRALRITVADTGTGIPAHVQRRIFEPFFTTKPPGSGTGLGLSTVNGIVRRYGGAIGVESDLGTGARFVITLPLSEKAGARRDEPSSVAALPADGRDADAETVLVVDDEPDVRTGVAEILRGCGYRVLEAGDAGAALDLAARAPDPIDLLVTDVVMPGMGGPELADRLRDRFPDVEVLFVSGHADIESTAPCLRGATLLRKPVHGTALIAQVQYALAWHGTRVRARSDSPRPAP